MTPATKPSRPPLLPFHYGWLMVGAGALCIFACLGFGRFAIGMLLPSMGKALGLTYAQMGFLSTFNFIGYLLAVLFVGRVCARFGTRPVIFLALLLVGGTMILIGKSSNYAALLSLYTLTGVGSGAANVPMMALVTVWFAPHLRGRAGGFVVIGSGFAILLAGKLIPYVNRLVGPAGWRWNWMIIGGVVIAAALLCVWIIRNRPEDLGLLPVGSATRKPAPTPADAVVSPPEGTPLSAGTFLHLGAIYFLFGYTYVIYATFIVTSLVQERGFSEAAAGSFWSWVGLLSLLSGPVFGSLSDRWGRRAGLTLVFSVQTAAYLFAGLDLPIVFLYASIGLFGIVAWSIPSIMAALVGDRVGPLRAAHVFGMVTFVFALGQISGPAVAGLLAEHAGGFGSSFLMAAACTCAAAVLCRFLGSDRIAQPR